MDFVDRVSAENVRYTADGYLVADARVARTGVQVYTGAEVGRPDLNMVRVYRPESEVFSADSLRTYAYRPMTNDHPAGAVTAENWRDVSIGQTGGEVVRDGQFVRVPLIMMDAAAISDYKNGKRELSQGYKAELVFGDGVTPDGEQYDAVMGKIRMNHTALVRLARGGDNLRIGDGLDNQEHETMTDVKTKVVLVDGLSVETTDAGAQAIAKLQADLADAKAAGERAKAAHDAEIAKRDASIDALKAQVMTDAQIDAKVSERADLIGKAKAVHDADYTGKSPDDIRRMVVLAKVGDSMTGKSGDYIAARFDILCDSASADPVRAVLANGVVVKNVKDNGQSAYEKRLTGAWNKQA